MAEMTQFCAGNYLDMSENLEPKQKRTTSASVVCKNTSSSSQTSEIVNLERYGPCWEIHGAQFDHFTAYFLS